MLRKIKKILFLTIDFPPMGGGMARLSGDVALALKEDGYEAIVVAPSSDGDAAHDEYSAFRVHRVKGIVNGHIFDHYLRSIVYCFACGLRFCFPRRVSMIITNTWSISGVSAFLIHKITGIPYAVFAHGLDVCAPKHDRKASWLMRAVLRDAVYVIAISGFTRQLVAEIEKKANVVIINPCVDITRFAAGPKAISGPKNVKRKIITVARLVKSKGYDIVLKALPKVIERFPDIEYFIIGDGPEGEHLKALAGELGLSRSVIFTGAIDEAALISYYCLCDLFILTSRELEASGEVEGFGIVFLEAGACAKAVIGSRSGGIPEAVIDGVTGLLVEESDINETAEAIIKLLSDDDLRRRLGDNGKMKVDKEMNTAVFAEKLGRILSGTAA